ncbi:MAG: hypothetical protein L0229_12445, partial [Blastocatellia bacterium]|nr:hypothetical protein [Blastocatellia bacterium]
IIMRVLCVEFGFTKLQLYQRLSKLSFHPARSIKRAVAIAPDDPYPHYRLGMMYIDLGDKPAAVEECRILEELRSRVRDKDDLMYIYMGYWLEELHSELLRNQH